MNPRGKHARDTVRKIRAPRRANPSLNLSWPIAESVLYAACTQTRTDRGSMHREPSRRVRIVHAEWWGELKRGGAEGWGRGRRVRCSIGHYLRRVTGSVVTAPRFAHWLPVLHRSPTLSPSLSRPSISFLPRSLRLSPVRLVFFVYSLRSLLTPTARLSTVSPLRNLAHDSRGGHRRLDLGLEARRAARKTSAFFFPVSQRERLCFTRLPLACFFAGDTTVTVVFERGGSPSRHGALLEGACFWRLNEPPSGLLTLLLRISLGRLVGGDRNAFVANELDYSLSNGFRSDCCFCFFFFLRLEFFGWISIVLLSFFFFFTNVSFFEEVEARDAS